MMDSLTKVNTFANGDNFTRHHSRVDEKDDKKGTGGEGDRF